MTDSERVKGSVSEDSLVGLHVLPPNGASGTEAQKETKDESGSEGGDEASTGRPPLPPSSSLLPTMRPRAVSSHDR
jgi:hypothetical protein